MVRSSEVLRLPSGVSSKLVLSGEHTLPSGKFLTTAPGGNAPEGFLFKVIDSEISGGETVVDVRPASLYEAVPSGSLRAGPEDFGAAGSTYESDEAGQAHAVMVRLSAAADSEGEAGRVFAPFSESVECTEEREMSVGGSIRTSFEPRFEMRWGRLRSLRTAVEGATAAIDGRVDAVAEARAEQAGECKLGPVSLLRPEWPAVVLAGPVPVPVTLSLPIELSASAAVRGRTRVAAHAGIRGTLGIVYRGGRPHGINEADPYAGIDPPEVKAYATASALIGPVATIEVGWRAPGLGKLAATAEVGIFSGISLAYNIRKPSQVEACVPLRATAAIRLHLPLRKRFSKEVVLKDEKRGCKR